mmetsp:Transcript_25232/g.74175  ORF Transcript_25232/g.74175 Transcript_25232/m.74175 type:complete len:298 (-) Transcript_25232:548-1441(-)
MGHGTHIIHQRRALHGHRTGRHRGGIVHTPSHHWHLRERLRYLSVLDVHHVHPRGGGDRVGAGGWVGQLGRGRVHGSHGIGPLPPLQAHLRRDRHRRCQAERRAHGRRRGGGRVRPGVEDRLRHPRSVCHGLRVYCHKILRRQSQGELPQEETDGTHALRVRTGIPQERRPRLQHMAPINSVRVLLRGRAHHDQRRCALLQGRIRAEHRERCCHRLGLRMDESVRTRDGWFCLGHYERQPRDERTSIVADDLLRIGGRNRHHFWVFPQPRRRHRSHDRSQPVRADVRGFHLRHRTLC